MIFNNYLQGEDIFKKFYDTKNAFTDLKARAFFQKLKNDATIKKVIGQYAPTHILYRKTVKEKIAYYWFMITYLVGSSLNWLTIKPLQYLCRKFGLANNWANKNHLYGHIPHMKLAIPSRKITPTPQDLVDSERKASIETLLQNVKQREYLTLLITSSKNSVPIDGHIVTIYRGPDNQCLYFDSNNGLIHLNQDKLAREIASNENFDQNLTFLDMNSYMQDYKKTLMPSGSVNLI
jgi:hypothetical protein